MLGQLGLPQAVGHVLGIGAGLGKFNAGLQRRIDKGAQHILPLTQHIVAAAAQNNAGPLGSQLFNDVALQNIDLVGQGHGVAHHVQAVNQAAAALVLAGGDGLLGQAAFFGGKGDQLLIVQGDTQLICDGLCDFAAAGCVLTRHCNDHRFLHTDTPHNYFCIVCAKWHTNLLIL